MKIPKFEWKKRQNDIKVLRALELNKKVERHDLSKRTEHLYHVGVFFFTQTLKFSWMKKICSFSKLLAQKMKKRLLTQANRDLENTFFN